MAINVSVQHNGGFLHGITMLTQSMLLPSSGNRFKCHEEALYLQPMISPKPFEFSPLTEGCSEGLDATIFFKHNFD